MEPVPHADWALVQSLGGPVKLAETLSWTKEGSVQRIQNWKFRGIPDSVKLERPDLFLRDLAARVAANDPAPQAEQDA